MQDIAGMQIIESAAELNGVAPDSVFFDILVRFLKFLNLSTNITMLSKLHHDVEVIFLSESITISNDIAVLD